jgi:hypothetical protein
MRSRSSSTSAPFSTSIPHTPKPRMPTATRMCSKSRSPSRTKAASNPSASSISSNAATSSSKRSKVPRRARLAPRHGQARHARLAHRHAGRLRSGAQVRRGPWTRRRLFKTAAKRYSADRFLKKSDSRGRRVKSHSAMRTVISLAKWKAAKPRALGGLLALMRCDFDFGEADDQASLSEESGWTEPRIWNRA